MTFDAWLLFSAIWFLAGIPLGPNALNCIAVAAGQGFGRALWAVVGILAAGLCYMAAVVLGLGALLLANEALFSALKLAGAVYLIWLGIKLLRRRPAQIQLTAVAQDDSLAIARRAALISFSNPKAMISYGAVFSQFVVVETALAPQLMVLVPTALAINAAIYGAYAALGLGVGRLLGSVRRQVWFDRSVGSLYVAAGAALAASALSGEARSGAPAGGGVAV